MARRRSGPGQGGGPDDPENLGDIDVGPLLGAYRRLDRRLQLLIVALLVIAGLVALVVYYQYQKQAWEEQNRSSQAHLPSATAPNTLPSPTASAVLDPNLLLGNPSHATSDPTNRTNYLMLKPYFDLSYNDATATPNWVSWRVTASDLGSAPRKQTFDPDPTLPPGFYRVQHRDYSGSGFDRGHMCPHSDRAANVEMSYATFVLTNVIPQAPNVNRKAWEQLESYCRDLVSVEHRHLYVVAGPTGRGGRGSNGPAEAIGAGRITVPAQCWKVVVVVPEQAGEDDLSKINQNTRVITVLMPNDNDAVGEDWSGFRTSAAVVEQTTGLHFFESLTPEIAESLRNKVDGDPITPPRLRRYGD